MSFFNPFSWNQHPRTRLTEVGKQKWWGAVIMLLGFITLCLLVYFILR